MLPREDIKINRKLIVLVVMNMTRRQKQIEDVLFVIMKLQKDIMREIQNKFRKEEGQYNGSGREAKDVIEVTSSEAPNDGSDCLSPKPKE